MEKGKEVGENGVTIEIDIVLTNCVENKLVSRSKSILLVASCN
jgi:hypothetical protein